MLSIRLSKDMEARLTRVARKTGRTKSFCARQAIEEKIEEMEDLAVAIERLERPGKTLPLEKVAKQKMPNRRTAQIKRNVHSR